MAGELTGSPGVAASAVDRYSERYKRWALILLMLIYTSNFVDRTVLQTLGQAVKQDLLISDTQLGLLQGFAFALFYCSLGIPIARLAERFSRVNILSLSVLIWSAMTAFCGFAANFAGLFFCRVGVGFGEAGCSPASQSLITDYYPPEKRSSALSIYSFGLPLGGMIGAMVGGYIAEYLNWRIAFFVVGAPGIVLAIAAKLLLREPPRGLSDPGGVVGRDDADVPPLRMVAARLYRNRSFIHMTFGATLVTFMNIGGGAFVQPYFVRAFHLGLAQVGMAYGLVSGLSWGLGTLAGGFLSDLGARRDRRWYAWIPGISVLVSLPLYLAAYLAPYWLLAATLLVLPGLFAYTYLAPTFGVMHNLVEPRMRASATALLFSVINLVASGLGPVFTGFLSDHLSHHAFAAYGLGTFDQNCPGGIALKTAAAAMSHACATASAWGTRWAILITYSVGLWSAMHFFLAARSLRSDLERADRERLQGHR